MKTWTANKSVTLVWQWHQLLSCSQPAYDDAAADIHGVMDCIQKHYSNVAVTPAPFLFPAGIRWCCRRYPWSLVLRPKKLSASVAMPPAPVRVRSQRPLAPSVASVTSVANDKGDPRDCAQISWHLPYSWGKLSLNMLHEMVIWVIGFSPSKLLLLNCKNAFKCSESGRGPTSFMRITG